MILPLSLFFSSQSFLLRLVVYHSLKCRSKSSLRTKASQRGCVNWRDQKSRRTRERYEWRMSRYTSCFSSVHAQCNVRLQSLYDDECQTHRSRSGRRFNLSSQQKFHHHVNNHQICSQKMQKLK